MEIKEALDSLKENLSKKATNPFFGTLIVVWIINNIELVYVIFNFDNDTKLDQKLIRIKTHFETHQYIPTLLKSIFITFVVLIVTYLLLAIARYISNIYEKVIIPWIYQITDKSSVILKSENDKAVERISFLDKKLKETSDEKYSLQIDTDRLKEDNRKQLEEFEIRIKKELSEQEIEYKTKLNNAEELYNIWKANENKDFTKMKLQQDIIQNEKKVLLETIESMGNEHKELLNAINDKNLVITKLSTMLKINNDNDSESTMNLIPNDIGFIPLIESEAEKLKNEKLVEVLEMIETTSKVGDYMNKESPAIQKLYFKNLVEFGKVNSQDNTYAIINLTKYGQSMLNYIKSKKNLQ